jgi:hypothetical protein
MGQVTPLSLAMVPASSVLFVDVLWMLAVLYIAWGTVSIVWLLVKLFWSLVLDHELMIDVWYRIKTLVK